MWLNIKSFLLNSPSQSGVSAWMLIGVAIVFSIFGGMLARFLSKGFGRQAEMLSLTTRKNQSDFDLANRDVTKVRKDLDVELAKHGEYIRRWKRN